MDRVAECLKIPIRYWCYCIVAILFSLFSSVRGQENPLQRRISIQLHQVPAAYALKETAKRGKFLLSYDASVIDESRKVSIRAENQPSEKILREIVGEGHSFRSGGSHVIILPPKKAASPTASDRQSHSLAGIVTDAGTGERLPFASVYEIGQRNTVLSNPDGIFHLPLKNLSGNTRILVSRKNYRDTVLSVPRGKHEEISIRLQPLAPVDPLVPLSPAVPVELSDNSLFRTTLSEKQFYQTENLPMYEQRFFQLSFLPALGTNRSFSGLVENHCSLNLLGGYSMALSGGEMAGLFNITRRYVKGFQLSGLMNITGGDVQGFQLAGFMNNTIGGIKGSQVSGFYNLSLDSLKGAQITGFFNMARKNASGLQAAGFLNISWKNMKGVQAGGFLNIGRTVSGGQLAGFGNAAWRDMNGLQVAGFHNFSSGKVRGMQLAGGINVCTDTLRGVQTSAIVNFSRNVQGLQLGGMLNIAGQVKGCQLGLINICDTIKGAAIGLISIVRKGYHALELSGGTVNPVLLSFRTGTHAFYTIISVGVFQPVKTDFVTFGYGIGTEFFGRKRFCFGIDAVASVVFNQAFRPGVYPDIWGRSNLYFGYTLAKKVRVFTGPSFNTYHISYTNLTANRPSLKYHSIYKGTLRDGTYTGFLGWQAGVRFF